MERIEPTRVLALKVWWAFMWRALLAALVTGVVLGTVFTILGMLLGLPMEALTAFSGLLGLVLGAAVSVEMMYRALRTKYGDVEIAFTRSLEGHHD
ncbi:MAG: hypothetical protein WCU88_02175 [Elusimicrobiota bacterium]